MFFCEAKRLFELGQRLHSIVGRAAISFKLRYQRLLFGDASPERSDVLSRRREKTLQFGSHAP